MQIRTLILDWNGTVMDDARRALDGVNIALADQSRPPITLDELTHRFTQPIGEFFRRLDLEPERAEAAWTRHVASTPAPMRADAAQLFHACRRRAIPLGILSSAAADVVRGDLARRPDVGLPDWIDGAVSDKAGQLRRRTEQSPQPVAYVGDSPSDIAAAKHAGCIAIGILGGLATAQDLQRADPDLTISELAELTSHLTPGSM